MEKIIKKSLLNPIVIPFMLLVSIATYTINDNQNTSSTIKNNIKQSHIFENINEEYTQNDMIQFIFSSYTHNTKKITNLAENINSKKNNGFIIDQLLNALNYEMAVKKANLYPKQKMSRFILSVDAFIKKDFQSAKKYSAGSDVLINQIINTLAKRELGEDYQIPKKIEEAKDIINDKKIPANQILSEILLENRNMANLFLAYKVNPSNILAVVYINKTLTNAKEYEMLVDFNVNMKKNKFNNFIRAQLIENIPDDKNHLRVKLIQSINKKSVYYPLAVAIYEYTNDNYEKALKVIKKSAVIKHYYYYLMYGAILEKNKKYYEAMDKLEVATKLSNNNPDVMNFLYYISIEQNINVKQSLKKLLVAYKANPSPYIADSVGWAYYKLKRYKRAVAYLEKASEKLPLDGVVNDHLGDAYLKLGRNDEAITQWKRVIELDKDNEYIDISMVKRKIKKYSENAN